MLASMMLVASLMFPVVVVGKKKSEKLNVPLFEYLFIIGKR
jgi:hypothetical protein